MSIDDLLTNARQLLKEGATEAAARACQQALRADPDSIPAIVLMAKIARTADEPAAAERLVHHALRESGGLGDTQLWFQLALALAAQHRLREAAQAYYQVVLIEPRAVATWINLTALNVDIDLWRQGEYCARRALECDPKSTAALINLGEVLRGRSKIEGTIACLEQALRLNPESALAHWNLALALLARGDFEHGWPHYEWRDRANQVSLDPYPQSRWAGESLAGQSLLVHAEQGLGDEILFASCYDDLLLLGGHCILSCDPRLVPLLRRSFPAATVVGFQRRKDRQPVKLDQEVDWQIPAGSLPNLFRRRAEDFPNRRRFLAADPALVLRWRERFESLGRSLKVGISWRAGGQLVEQRKRTTRLDQWQHLLAIPGISWINLQYGDTGNDRAWAQSALGITIHDWSEGDPLVDVDSFSARMAALDLVICVDNSTAHLGGALGVETWVLLPLVPDWRWGLEGESSLWYSSLRLVRQTAAGAWEPLFVRLAAELRTRAGDVTMAVPAQSIEPGQRFGPAPGPVLSSVAGDVQAALRQAQTHFDGGRLDEAEMVCRAVLSVNPRQIRALHLLSRIALRTDRVQLAIDSLRRAVSLEQRPDFYVELAKLLTRVERRDEAIAELERAVAVDPRYLPAWHALDNLTSAVPRSAQFAASAVDPTIH
ncbi:MAG TPA: tetratricopeptide repeat protein [Pirellulales bacterium]|jgi:tetratricopeptide (TPR) repeat protein|nr:tetratricopeptide repeat protein [Pirellulales bacterium]